jgi:hypothetical protein
MMEFIWTGFWIWTICGILWFSTAPGLEDLHDDEWPKMLLALLAGGPLVIFIWLAVLLMEYKEDWE